MNIEHVTETSFIEFIQEKKKTNIICRYFITFVKLKYLNRVKLSLNLESIWNLDP